MNKRAFVRWLVRQRLTPLQTSMAAILYDVNGAENAITFVQKVQGVEQVEQLPLPGMEGEGPQ